MITVHQMNRLRKLEKMKQAELGIEEMEELDDAEIISRWYHNTNKEASEELLKRLKLHHPEMDHD